jgi:hypothetical protein
MDLLVGATKPAGWGEHCWEQRGVLRTGRGDRGGLGHDGSRTEGHHQQHKHGNAHQPPATVPTGHHA